MIVYLFLIYYLKNLKKWCFYFFLNIFLIIFKDGGQCSIRKLEKSMKNSSVLGASVLLQQNVNRDKPDRCDWLLLRQNELTANHKNTLPQFLDSKGK